MKDRLVYTNRSFSVLTNIFLSISMIFWLISPGTNLATIKVSSFAIIIFRYIITLIPELFMEKERTFEQLSAQQKKSRMA